MAKLYADEHIPSAVLKGLLRVGHDVVRAAEALREGADDMANFLKAIEQERVLLTQDTDFLAISDRWLSEGKHHSGIVYCPQGVYSIGEVIRRLRTYLDTTISQDRQDYVKFL